MINPSVIRDTGKPLPPPGPNRIERVQNVQPNPGNSMSNVLLVLILMMQAFLLFLWSNVDKTLHGTKAPLIATTSSANRIIVPKLPEPPVEPQQAKPVVAFPDDNGVWAFAIFEDGTVRLNPDTSSRYSRKDYARFFWRDMDAYPKNKLKDGKFLPIGLAGFAMEIDAISHKVKFVPENVGVSSDLKVFWSEIEMAGQPVKKGK